MRNWILGGIAVAFFASIGLAFAMGVLNVGVNSGACMVDDEVPPAERQSAGDAGLAIANAILTGDGAKASAMLTADARTAFPPDKLAKFMKAVNLMMGGLSHDTAVAHVYLVKSAGGGPDARAICGSVSGDRWVSVEIKPGLRQAHVVITTQTRNNSWEFTTWLLPEGDGWRAQYVNVNPSAIIGYSVDDLLAMARRQRDTGHMFNAALLYAGVQQLINRGPSFQLGVVQTANSEMQAFSLPSDLAGQPPFIWTMDGKAYAVAQVSIIGIGKQLGLVFVLPQKSWPSEMAIDAGSREFLDAFRKRHPDYALSFSFLVARAMKPDNSGGFGTVYDNAKGYDR